MTARPRVSVVVALIAGETGPLERCLQALATQRTVQPYEVLVPYDPPCAHVLALQSTFPSVRFLPVDIDTATARAGSGREHHDRLRTVGLRAAAGDIVVLTEDHAYLSPDWCASAVDVMTTSPRAGAVGGAVECDAPWLLNRAVWFCDFGRYQQPLPDGPSEFASDANIAYRREALAAVADAWRDDYHETSVHWALQQRGFDVYSSSRLVAWQARARLSWRRALIERYAWGRSFAGTRAALVGARRWVLALGTPLLPLVMTWRLFRVSFVRRRHAADFLKCAIAIVILQTGWALGECVGYITARADGGGRLAD